LLGASASGIEEAFLEEKTMHLSGRTGVRMMVSVLSEEFEFHTLPVLPQDCGAASPKPSV
jgi:hypothetical protein